MRVLIPLLLLVSFDLVKALGKSDRRPADDEEEEEEIVDAEGQQEFFVDEELFDSTPHARFPAGSVTKESILENHLKVDSSKKTFAGASLAYITPWNNRGYDLAKWAAKKFTHISPVWFQIRAVRDGYNCRIDGTHDIDQGWIADVRSNSSSIRVVPRVLFDNWAPDDLVGFLQSETWGRNCARTLIAFLQEEKFEGAVVELWTALMAGTQGKADTYLIELLTMWGDFFHKKNLELILPVAPPITPEGPTPIFTAQHLEALAGPVDYIQVMTYDYQGDLGVAPLSWVEECTRHLVGNNDHVASHLLIGLNHYGYAYEPGKHLEAFVDNKYLELLKNEKSKLIWDPKAGEHYVKLGNARYNYPSLTSLEARINVARKYGVGVAIWDLGQGLNYFTQTL